MSMYMLELYKNIYINKIYSYISELEYKKLKWYGNDYSTFLI